MMFRCFGSFYFVLNWEYLQTNEHARPGIHYIHSNHIVQHTNSSIHDGQLLGLVTPHSFSDECRFVTMSDIFQIARCLWRKW